MASWSEDGKFVDLCILAGTDYLPALKGVGIKTAHAALKRSSGLEESLRVPPLSSMVSKAFDSPSDSHAYLVQAAKVRSVFRHALVYDPRAGAVVPLNPLPRGAQLPSHLGKVFDVETARRVCADASLDPQTLQPRLRDPTPTPQTRAIAAAMQSLIAVAPPRAPFRPSRSCQSLRRASCRLNQILRRALRRRGEGSRQPAAETTRKQGERAMRPTLRRWRRRRTRSSPRARWPEKVTLHWLRSRSLSRPVQSHPTHTNRRPREGAPVTRTCRTISWSQRWRRRTTWSANGSRVSQPRVRRVATSPSSTRTFVMQMVRSLFSRADRQPHVAPNGCLWLLYLHLTDLLLDGAPEVGKMEVGKMEVGKMDGAPENPRVAATSASHASSRPARRSTSASTTDKRRVPTCTEASPCLPNPPELMGRSGGSQRRHESTEWWCPQCERVDRGGRGRCSVIRS